MKNRITPESQKTRLPFSLFLLIALIGVILLGCLHTWGDVVIYSIGRMDVIINGPTMSYIEEGAGAISLSQIILLLIIDVSYLLSDTIPLILCAICVIMALLIIFKKRNFALFIPSAAMAVMFAACAVFGIIAILLLFSINIISIIAADYYYIDYLFINLYNCIVDTLYSAFGALSVASLAIASIALSLLFFSCGKGFIGIFKRAQKLCFAIFCIVIGVCALGIAADILYSVFWNAQNIIQGIIYFVQILPHINYIADGMYYNVTVVSLIIDNIILPIYTIFDTRIIMNTLLLITIFAIGLWLYSPHKKVRPKKKKKIDLVEYVELEYGDDEEVTVEVIDGDNDDEFVNISVHRAKAHDNEQVEF